MRRGWLGLGVLVTLSLVASSALADEPRAAPAGPSSTTLVVILVLSVGAAYLLANFVVDWLQKRFLVAEGAEFLVVGIMLGPSALNAVADLSGLLPVISLAAGWVGLLRGMEISRRRMQESPAGTVRLALGDALFAGTLVAAAAYVGFASGMAGPLTQRETWLSSIMLGCCAGASHANTVMLAGRYELEGKIVLLLERGARLGDVIVVYVFGLLFCVFHEAQGESQAALVLNPWQWGVVSVLLGIVLGVSFRPFMGENDTPAGRFLALVGIITFSSGAAYFLNLSPLFVNLVLGAALVNTARYGKSIHASLESTERPMTLLLLVLAGALLRAPPLGPTLVGIAAFIVLRLLGKRVGSFTLSIGSPVRGDLYRGLLAHGDVTLAMAISFRIVYQGVAVDIAYAIVLASFVIHSWIAPRMLRSLLVDAGQILREQRTPVAAKVAVK